MDNVCKDCLGIGLCEKHKIETEIAYQKRNKQIALAAQYHERAQLERDNYHNGCDLNHNED